MTGLYARSLIEHDWDWAMLSDKLQPQEQISDHRIYNAIFAGLSDQSPSYHFLVIVSIQVDCEHLARNKPYWKAKLNTKPKLTYVHTEEYGYNCFLMC